ncbi:zinc finger domain-containing protein [Streptomyces sp. BR1]|uniref:zinc finger domain-containing protein n=1 Tax=Streptomyces sp. BR1 TaxID=1592323 RepID=UPI00402BBF68
MNHEHVAALLHHAAALDSRLHRTMATDQQAATLIRTWTDVLRDIPAVVECVRWDAAVAVSRFYDQSGGDRSAKFHAIQPSDIRAAWSPHRAELMNRHVDPTPAADPDDVGAYLSELRADRAAVASGRVAPSGQRRLGPAPTGSPKACTAAGGAIPAQIRRELAGVREGALKTTA